MRTDRRGNYAIEFGLTLPVLLVLASGMIDLGRELSFSDQVATAVSEGARAGALVDPRTGADPAIVAQNTTTFVWTKMETGYPLTVVVTTEGAAPDRMLRVTGTAHHDVLFGFVPLPDASSYSEVVRLDRQ